MDHIDSGATDHIASSLEYFSSYSKINPIQVHLPNKSIVIAYISGTVIFSPNLFFTTRKYTLIFDDFVCTIQDKHSLDMIGLANVEQGLYLLNVNKEAKVLQPKNLPINNNAVHIISSSNLWHFRLGHLSGNRLNCHFAKQRKLSFNSSSSKALKIFDLVHMDIWGSFSRASIHGEKYF
jgi:hypothetical protein